MNNIHSPSTDVFNDEPQVEAAANRLATPRPHGRLVRVGAAVLCCFIAAGCMRDGGTTDAAPQDNRPNAPQTAPYYLDTDSDYYRNLGKALGYTDDPFTRANIERLQQTPVAEWLAGTDEQTYAQLDRILPASAEAGAVPLLVAYKIPNRDHLGGESKGGNGSADEYLAWVDTVSDKIGDAPAVLVYEPDAIAAAVQMINDGDNEGKDERVKMINTALTTFKDNNANLAIYVDVGHSDWLNTDEELAQLTGLLDEIDPDGDLITGLAFNVSNQMSTEANTAYAEQIKERMGRDFYAIIDVSMNGAPGTDQIKEWCNPKGEKLGTADDAIFDAQAAVEQAFIKTPGQSDGRCGTSEEAAGVFDGALLQRQASKPE
ncbi:glycoside hydrolase family 6 protein [Candidatus Saccharibacteria bacterium]|nr:glycoside hydrolase family 6 protein [Candidatus Saccharibacteria bacterium]